MQRSILRHICLTLVDSAPVVYYLLYLYEVKTVYGNSDILSILLVKIFPYIFLRYETVLKTVCYDDLKAFADDLRP